MQEIVNYYQIYNFNFLGWIYKKVWKAVDKNDLGVWEGTFYPFKEQS